MSTELGRRVPAQDGRHVKDTNQYIILNSNKSSITPSVRTYQEAKQQPRADGPRRS